MNSQQANRNKQEQASLIVCIECGAACRTASHSDIGSDQSTETFIITVQDTQAYCLRCLQQKVREEILEARILQQRYIYHKEFQSSFEQIQLNKKNQLQEHLSQNQRLNEEIVKLKQDQSQLQKNLDALRQDSIKLKQKIYSFEVEQQKFWEGINKVERRTNKVQEKSMSTKFDKQQQKDLFDSLSKISVIHLFSDIFIDDNLALVQGMAMGRKTENSQVSWEEVAIGLSHLLIALNFLALKYSFQYKNIQEIKIKGILSQIILKGKKKKLYALNSKQNEKQFGQFLEVLLAETAYLSEYILQAQSIQYSQQFRIPFLISTAEGKIAELHIDPYKMDQRVRWNTWTKAMRYFLINFKHMITVYAINDKFL